jgi:hypothetical protein
LISVFYSINSNVLNSYPKININIDNSANFQEWDWEKLGIIILMTRDPARLVGEAFANMVVGRVMGWPSCRIWRGNWVIGR